MKTKDREKERVRARVRKKKMKSLFFRLRKENRRTKAINHRTFVIFYIFISHLDVGKIKATKKKKEKKEKKKGNIKIRRLNLKLFSMLNRLGSG